MTNIVAHGGNNSDPKAAFMEAIAGAGLPTPDHIIADGQLHRFSTNGKPGDKSGVYILHLDGVPAGYFECWRQGIKQKWSARKAAKPDAAELERLKADIARAERERAAHAHRRAETARQLWDASVPANADHPYLVKKGIKEPPGIRQTDIDRTIFFEGSKQGGMMNNCLLIPVETPDGLQSLQAITPDGFKAFMSGGSINGGYYTLAGDGGTVYLAEGVATAQSIHEATGSTVMAAFNSGNLPKVAEHARQDAPSARIVVAGDNDHANPKNPGKAAAEAAAKACGGSVALPPAGENGTDWNDYHATYGLASVRAELEINDGDEGDAFDLSVFSLTDKAEEMETKMKDDTFILGGLAIVGQMTAFYAKPNSGKTLLTLRLLIDAIKRGDVDGKNVYYVNADDNYKGLVTKLKIAKRHGFHMLAPGHGGFKSDALVNHLDKLVMYGKAAETIIVLDTLKKFTDLMDKQAGSSFMARVREFVSHGGTVVMLAHTNKHRDADGKLVFAGTSDVVDDIDCAYIMDMVDSGTSDKTVMFENFKSRGDVDDTATYRFSKQAGQDYAELVASVTKVSDEEARQAEDRAKTQALLEKNHEIIEAVREAVGNDEVPKQVLLDAGRDAGYSRAKVQRAIRDHTGSDWLAGHRWSAKRGEKNAQLFSLLWSLDAAYKPAGDMDDEWL